MPHEGFKVFLKTKTGLRPVYSPVRPRFLYRPGIIYIRKPGYGPFTAFESLETARSFFEAYAIWRNQLIILPILYKKSLCRTIWRPKGVRVPMSRLPRGTLLLDAFLIKEGVEL